MMAKQQQTAIVLIQKLNELEEELEIIHQQMHHTDHGFFSCS